ncbi:hypothetical protein CROQUDRAFT_89766 [Cronartium quercuum f. sp. fusiforme G11]|uniref:Uncharacterized protein n=1 Tax=Cronartium quercuum f. sp. fusiforme G11 TaxID=708437 RepID=A0A9P6TEK3_9BASI|nr:hypothetical protein CROQUDRAFT_89766 [Cronartium quercuum f. sp. fusiforme G11]
MVAERPDVNERLHDVATYTKLLVACLHVVALLRPFQSDQFKLFSLHLNQSESPPQAHQLIHSNLTMNSSLSNHYFELYQPIASSLSDSFTSTYINLFTSTVQSHHFNFILY